MAHCENCGNRIGIHGCTWCNEELYIVDQYYDQDMDLPSPDSELMKKATEQQKRIDSGQDKTSYDFKKLDRDE